MALRLRVSEPLQKAKDLESDVLPLNSDVIGNYFYLRKKLHDTDPKFLKNLLRFNEIKASLWKKASLVVMQEASDALSKTADSDTSVAV